MTPIDLGDDDGFADVTADGVTVRVDIYAVQNKIVDLGKANADDNPGFLKQVSAYMAELGFPSGISNRTAYRFSMAIQNAVTELEKKDVPVTA